MQQAQSWEIPGYYVKDRTAPVRGYDWYGSYEHVRNIDQRYVDELEGNYTFGHPKHQNLVSVQKIPCVFVSTWCTSKKGGFFLEKYVEFGRMVKSILFKVCSIACYSFSPSFEQFVNTTTVKINRFGANHFSHLRKNRSAVRQVRD